MAKCNDFRNYRVHGLTFYAFAVETYGYLDEHFMEYIRLLATAACATGKVKFGAFVASSHREVSGALCKQRKPCAVSVPECSCTHVAAVLLLREIRNTLGDSI